MRVSVDKSDLGYHPRGVRCRVFLAGSERNNVITADEEKRMAVLVKLDEHGRPTIKGDQVQTEIFYGDVRIERPEPWSPYTPAPEPAFSPVLQAAGMRLSDGGEHGCAFCLVGEQGPGDLRLTFL